MAKGLIDFLADAVSDWYWTDEKKGKYGEKLTERKLKIINAFGMKGMVLKNVYIPKENGETSEIDLLYITPKGIFVFESKNYSGWIFGDIKSQYWTACLPNGDKNRFYNPIKQNYNHVKWLAKYMAGYTAAEIPMISIIVFSERCELKKVPDDSKSVIICQRNELYGKIKGIWNELPDILSEQDMMITYNILFGLTNVSEEEKQAHIENIKEKTNKTIPDSPAEAAQNGTANEAIYCPDCGGLLVLRTARKGPNAGKQFYGCSNFPKCRFITNI